jgi:uncharacterized protein YdhG (YjbR/CyaY superfamily)
LVVVADAEEYLAGLDADAQAAFAHLRSLVERLAPEATLGMSYGAPALRYRGRPLLGMSAARDHLTLMPFSPAAVDTVRARLGDHRASKGVIQFTADRLLPDEVVTELVRARMAEIERA